MYSRAGNIALSKRSIALEQALISGAKKQASSGSKLTKSHFERSTYERSKEKRVDLSIEQFKFECYQSKTFADSSADLNFLDIN